jgi:hypothetical protein
VDRRVQEEEKSRQVVWYVYDRAYLLFICTLMALYAVNKEVDFLPHNFSILRLKDTAVTDNHWSVRGENQ